MTPNEPAFPEGEQVCKHGRRMVDFCAQCLWDEQEKANKQPEAYSEARGDNPLSKDELTKALENCAFIAKKMEEQEKLYFDKRKELESKPPLSALDEKSVRQNVQASINTWSSDKGRLDKFIAKSICSKFGTPPAKKVGVESIEKILINWIYQKELTLRDCAQSILDHLEGKK